MPRPPRKRARSAQAGAAQGSGRGALVRRGPQPRGKGPHDFRPHLQAVKLHLPDKHKEIVELHAHCQPELGIELDRFRRQLCGTARYNPALPMLLAEAIDLSDYGIVAQDWEGDGAAFEAKLPRRQPPAGRSKRLKALLDGKSNGTRVNVELKQASEPPVELRKIGPRSDAKLLRDGPCHLHYDTPFPGAASVFLLALEHDRNKDEWVLANAIAEVDLSLKRGVPACGIHGTPIHVLPESGIFDLFMIAARTRFPHKLEHLAGRLAEKRQDGTIDNPMLDQLTGLLEEKFRNGSAGDTAVGRFTYRVRV